jgi:hypothetical protein
MPATAPNPAEFLRKSLLRITPPPARKIHDERIHHRGTEVTEDKDKIEIQIRLSRILSAILFSVISVPLW